MCKSAQRNIFWTAYALKQLKSKNVSTNPAARAEPKSETVLALDFDVLSGAVAANKKASAKFLEIKINRPAVSSKEE